MKTIAFLLFLLLAVSGCEEEPTTVKAPQRRRVVVNYSIVVISRDNCVWCERQHKLLSDMRKAGELKGVLVRGKNHTSDALSREEYPAKAYPTLYIHGASGDKVVVGYHDRSAILKLLK